MNVEYEKKIGQTIRALRLERQLSQESLAAKMQLQGCDMTRSALAKIEVGRRHLYADELKSIKNALQVTYEVILGK